MIICLSTSGYLTTQQLSQESTIDPHQETGMCCVVPSATLKFPETGAPSARKVLGGKEDPLR